MEFNKQDFFRIFKAEQFDNDPINFTKFFRHGYNQYTNNSEILPLLKFEEKIIEHIHKNQFSVINKSRQMHLTSILSAYVVWQLVSKKQTTILYVSHNMDAGKRFKQKVHEILEYLPAEMFDKETIYRNNQKEIVLKNGSFFRATAPSSEAGKGFGLDMVIFDECAFTPYLEQMYVAIGMNISARNGKCIMLSTPQFEGDVFHKIYSEAKSRSNIFSAIDVHWSENPLYRTGFSLENGKPTSDWYKQKCIELNNDQDVIDSELNLKFRKKPKNKEISITLRLDRGILNKVMDDMCDKNMTNLSDYIRQAIQEKLEKKTYL